MYVTNPGMTTTLTRTLTVTVMVNYRVTGLIIDIQDVSLGHTCDSDRQYITTKM